MEQTLLPDQPANGGYPEPPASEPVRVVVARHHGCGSPTRVRLPGAVPARAVRRLRCAGCEAAYETEGVEELGVEAPGAGAPGGDAPGVAAPAAAVEEPARAGRSRFDPRGRLWRWASVPIAMAAVAGALLLIQGGGGEPAGPDPSGDANPASAAGRGAAGKAQGGRRARGAGEARLVRGSRYALALPAGWRRSGSQGGAAFAAVAAGGGADATLWIERAPNLDFPAFESRSLDQLRSIAGSAQVVDRVTAPTPEATIVRLAADAPPGQPRLEVTLRAAGPYRYYLATTVQADASRQAVDGAELIHGSLTPESGGSG